MNSRRFLILALLAAFALPLAAKDRVVLLGRTPASPSMISGTVSAVNGNIISIANGAVTIDATNAKIVGPRDNATLASVTVGAQIHATLAENANGNPLPATMIAVTRNPDVALTGLVQSVDVAAKTFRVLGITIQVNDSTTIAGVSRDSATGINAIQTNQLVAVQADVQGTRVVAESVQILLPFPPPTQLLRGTVKSIGTDSWVITTERADVTVYTNANTRIAGNPKVGDKVDVLATTDAANRTVAVTITKAIEIPPIDFAHYSGTVKAITPAAWTFTDRAGIETTLAITRDTKFIGDPKVGDTVEVLVEVRDGKRVAVLITKSFLR